MSGSGNVLCFMLMLLSGGSGCRLSLCSLDFFWLGAVLCKFMFSFCFFSLCPCIICWLCLLFASVILVVAFFSFLRCVDGSSSVGMPDLSDVSFFDVRLGIWYVSAAVLRFLPSCLAVFVCFAFSVLFSSCGGWVSFCVFCWLGYFWGCLCCLWRL